MSSRQILFITERRKDEPRYLNRMFSILFDTKPENIFYYEANIHQMMINTPPEDYLRGDLDTAQILREDARRRNKTFPDGEFSDIFLIFDMDPHDQMYDGGEHLKHASMIFTESSEYGKLFINYPMMQSYKHIGSDEEYLNKVVFLEDIKRYKDVVDSECLTNLKHLSNYNEDTFVHIIALNLRKAISITNSNDEETLDEPHNNLNLTEILSIQIEKFDKESSIFVLNTSTLIPLELSNDLLKKVASYYILKYC